MLLQPEHMQAVDQPRMNCEPATCRIQARWSRDDVSGERAIRSLRDIKGLPNMTDSLRLSRLLYDSTDVHERKCTYQMT